MRIGDEHKVNVVVIEHVLRRFEPVVSADKIFHCIQNVVCKLEHHAYVEHLSAALIVLRPMCFAHLFCRSVKLPIDSLEHVEDEPQ